MNRSAVISLALVVAALVPAAAGASHKPGHAPGGGKVGSIGIVAEPTPVVFGQLVTIEGRLVAVDRAGKNVILESDPHPFEGNFGNVANATTSPSGAYVINQRPRLNTRYRVRQGSLASAVVTVLVRIRVSLRVGDATPNRGQRVRFAGRACPPHAGALVRIQRRRAAGGWSTVARTRARAATTCSKYAKRVRVKRDGTYRAVVAGDADHARGISRTRFLNVR